MILGEFIQRLKMELPNIGVTGVDDVYLTSLLNQGCNRSNLLVKAYKGYKDFDIEANKREYNIFDIVTDYLGTDKRGFYLLNSSSKWKKITPKTEEFLSKRYPDYLNAASVSIPTYYYINAMVIGFYPPPSSDCVNGGRLYYLKKAAPMTDDTHYPFTGSTSELSSLIPMDEAIISFVLWKVKPSYGENTDIDLGERRFFSECIKAAHQINAQRDLNSDSEYRISL